MIFLIKFFRKNLIQIFPFRLQIFFFAIGRDLFFYFLKRKFKPLKKNTFNQKKIKQNLIVEQFGLTFRHSLGNAAGFDKNGDLLNFHYQIGAGFAMVGTVLNKPHPGNLYSFFGKKVNVWLPLDKSRSAINSLGLPSIGIDKVILKIKKFRQQFVTKKNPHGLITDFPIGISLMGHPLEQEQQKLNGVLESIEKVAPFIEIIEINESCPNVTKEKQEDKIFADRIEQIADAITKANKKYSKKIVVFIKFAELKNISFLIDLMDNYNIHGITLSNTLRDYSNLMKNIDFQERKQFNYYTKNYYGGVSGRAIWENVIEKTNQLKKITVQKKSPLKIIHCGGIYNSKDLQMAKQNSVLQQWYTGFIDNYLNGNDVYRSVLGDD